MPVFAEPSGHGNFSACRGGPRPRETVYVYELRESGCPETQRSRKGSRQVDVREDLLDLLEESAHVIMEAEKAPHLPSADP